MPVRVYLSQILRRKYRPDCDPDRGIDLPSGAGKTLREISLELGIPFEEVSSLLVNHRVAEPGYVAKDGDHIQLLVILGGG
jgi:hypothetical protein